MERKTVQFREGKRERVCVSVSVSVCVSVCVCVQRVATYGYQEKNQES